MKLLDINLLLHAADESSAQNARARLWMERTLSGSEDVGFAWLALLGFLRISTNPVIYANALSAEKAFEFVESWLAAPVATVVHPTHRHAEVLRELLDQLGTAGNMTSDAHLAALAIEHGAELCSRDADFSRFKGLRWSNPLD